MCVWEDETQIWEDEMRARQQARPSHSQPGRARPVFLREARNHAQPRGVEYVCEGSQPIPLPPRFLEPEGDSPPRLNPFYHDRGSDASPLVLGSEDGSGAPKEYLWLESQVEGVSPAASDEPEITMLSREALSGFRETDSGRYEDEAGRVWAIINPIVSRSPSGSSLDLRSTTSGRFEDQLGNLWYPGDDGAWVRADPVDSHPPTNQEPLTFRRLRREDRRRQSEEAATRSEDSISRSTRRVQLWRQGVDQTSPQSGPSSPPSPSAA